MCPHCGYAHSRSSLPPCENDGCKRMDCLHSPVEPHVITVLSPPCSGYQAEEGTDYEGGGGSFGGGGASGGPW